MMSHVKEAWFERVAHRAPLGKTLSLSDTLVVVTDLVTHLDVLDVDTKSTIWRPNYAACTRKRMTIRFVPVERGSRAIMSRTGPVTPQGC